MTPLQARVYAPILVQMVELLASNPKLRFARALDVACAELAIDPPESVRTELLVRAFQILSSGRIEGCPDA